MAAQRSPAFRGRASECELLDRLLDQVRGGASAALVVRGEAGVGKTALLRHCARQAAGFRVVQIAGVESEMELPFAGLHQLCASMLGWIDPLPEPQQDALRVAFGLASGPAPDRFLVGLAALGLLAEASAERPLLCFVDDAQWLDDASGQVLGFVARRLLAEPVMIVFSLRVPAGEHRFTGVPELELGGLAQHDARALLATVVPGRLDDSIRDRIIAETRGNPLALLELPRGIPAAELAGGFGGLGRSDLTGQIEARYMQRHSGLPEATQRLMLLAAADPVGDATLLWRAAPTLGTEREAATPAEAEQLLEIGERVRFPHPLVRSAVYRSAAPEDRRAAHLALAAATDPQDDPDRRVWHRAAAAAGPNEDVASELERSAGRARARGGLAAAAAFLQRSVALTQHPDRRANRALAASQANLHAGAFDAALSLLAAAEAEMLDDLQRARMDLLRGQIASASGAGHEAPARLLAAGRRLEPLDPDLARETYLDAWGAAWFAGRLAGTGTLLEISRAARSAPRPTQAPHPCDLLLDGLAIMVTEGRTAAAPALRQAVSAFRGEEISVERGLQWSVLGASAAVTLWDFDSWGALMTRQMELARDAGALAPLSIAINGVGIFLAWSGDFLTATGVTAEADAVTQATGTRIAPYGAMLLAALRGEDAAKALIDAAVEEAVIGGEGLAIQFGSWVTAMLHNGHARYDAAFAAAQQASDDAPGLFISIWALTELIEAATRLGRTEPTADALARLAESATAGGSDWGLGILARSRALVSDGAVAEGHYAEAIERLGRTRLRPELARSHLLFGEWLRRQNRRVDAREHLRTAHDLFTTIGMAAFTERARHELLATGETVRKRQDATRTDLTPQETHIAQLARDGRTNPEIGAELFISARTVEWHLRKVFTKLDITSRKALPDALPPRSRDIAPV